jgi:hypothetical protein
MKVISPIARKNLNLPDMFEFQQPHIESTLMKLIKLGNREAKADIN